MRKFITFGLTFLMGTMFLTGCGKEGDKETTVGQTTTQEIVQTSDATTEETTTVTTTESTTTEETTVNENTDNENTSVISSDDSKARINAYKAALKSMKENLKTPDGMELGEPFESASVDDNTFGIDDIDNDGRDELIVNWENTYTAGMIQLIYEYNPENDTWNQEFLDYPGTQFYSNGVIFAYWSHNHGLGEAWPFTIYEYNQENDKYEVIGSVDSWSKKIAETDENGNPFPSEYDDGSGVVYTIVYRGSYNMYTTEQYDKLMDEIVGQNTFQYEMSYIPMTDSNIDGFEKE